MTGARVRYLSATQAEAYITIPAKAYGGAPRHSDSPTLKPIPSVRMIGRKYAMAYVTVVVQLAEQVDQNEEVNKQAKVKEHTYKKSNAKPQILKSSAGRRNLPRLNGSTCTSPRSRLTRRMTKASSFSFRKPQAPEARSGKSIRKI